MITHRIAFTLTATALALTLPPMMVYAAWFLGWGREADTGIAKAAPEDVIPMAWRGLSALRQIKRGEPRASCRTPG